MGNDYFDFNQQSCHGLDALVTGLEYRLPTGIGDTIFIDLNDIVYKFYTGQDPTRTPNIVNASNLPNNIYYNTGTKYLQGYLQDEGTYNIKLNIIESGVLCEKTLRLDCYNPNKKYIYKVNYPINIGFIKYNAPQRLGLE
jgi:hypothetical protein